MWELMKNMDFALKILWLAHLKVSKWELRWGGEVDYNSYWS